MAVIFGREHEVGIFDQIYRSEEPQFIAVYGRRRVGKTHLVYQYFSDKGVYFELTGVKGATLKTQLMNFQTVFEELFHHGEAQSSPKSWLEAMTSLRRKIDEIPEEEKVIVFVDELPWIATPKSGFLEALDHVWNRYLSRRKNMILVICGSAAAWMIDNIIYDTGGLHGRLSKEIHLLPFTISETEKFLQTRHVELNRKQLVDLFFVTGGVAKYLMMIKPGMSAVQLTSELCFSKDGYLFKEFHKLYRSLFNNYEHHIEIVRVLAGHPSGLARDDVLEKTKLSSGGTATKILDELCLSGFILKIPMFNNPNTVIYKLIDPYSLFYLQWIEPARELTLEGIEKDHWLKIFGTPKWYSWTGHAFENICIMHIDKLKDALGISGVSTKSSAWRFSGDEERGLPGAQIDLLADRADNCINLFEAKYYDQEFVITKEYAEKLNRKKHVFREVTGTKKALFMTLITPYGVKENAHYHECVQSQIVMDDLFDD